MWELIKKYRFHIAAGMIFLSSFGFFSLNLKNKEHANAFERGVMNVFSPLYSVTSGINNFFSGFWSEYMDLVNVRHENKQLRENLRVLNGQVLANQEAALSIERLRKLLDLKNSLQLPSMAASIIGEDGSPWYKTFVIDRGEVNGLHEGMPVVAHEGVVGQIVKVAARSSRILLLTDHASAIAGMVQRSRARGVVKGMGTRCSLEFTVREDDVKVGDTVITSGIGGIFPKGIPIGEVTMVKKGEYGIFQTIEIRPSVTMSRLEEVLVILQQAHD